MTDEQAFIQKKLLSLGIITIFSRVLSSIENNTLTSCCLYSDEAVEHHFDNLLLVTAREPKAHLFNQENRKNMTSIGDCKVPSSIADAVYSGHKFAREFGQSVEKRTPKRERVMILIEDFH